MAANMYRVGGEDIILRPRADRILGGLWTLVCQPHSWWFAIDCFGSLESENRIDFIAVLINEIRFMCMPCKHGSLMGAWRNYNRFCS